MPEAHTSDSAEPLSEVAIQSLISRHLPAWQQACDADNSDSIVLHEASFGTSTHELFLFACAIKYAAAKGKHVHVASGRDKVKQEPEKIVSAVVGSVYREKTSGKRRHPARVQRNSQRRKRKTA